MNLLWGSNKTLENIYVSNFFNEIRLITQKLVINVLENFSMLLQH